MIRRFLILAITIVFCYLIWWIGPLISIGTYFPLSGVLLRQIIIGLILFWAIWPIIALFFNRIFSYARMPIPNSKKKIVQLDPITARFFDALRTLRFISLSNKKNLYQKLKMRINQEYLNEKPWFLIIGPTGSGKTSLINQSGEDFISSEQYGFTNTSEMGPTKDCNWWFTERAVYIDTAGEWMLLHSENNEAGAARKKLFSLIRKYRHYPYIDGVMLCIDVSILLYSSLSEQKSLADTLRIRVAEVASYFLTDVPIYLFLNNIDKLPGGEVFLTILSDELLAQGLGIKLSSDQFNHNNFAVDETAYLALQERISNYVLESLHAIPNKDIRYQLILFTETLGALKKPLFAFLDHVFPPSPIGYSGCLRQLWFGSTLPLITKEALFDLESELIYKERKSGGMYYPALSQAISERGILQSVKYSPPHNNFIFAGRYILATLIIGALALILTSRSFWQSYFISSRINSVEKTTLLICKSTVINNTSDNLIAAFEALESINMQYSEKITPFLFPYFDHESLTLVIEQTYQHNLYQVFWPAVENYIESELKQEVLKSNIDIYDPLSEVFGQVYNKLSLISTYLQAGKILSQAREYSLLQDEAIQQPEPIRSIIMDLLSVGKKQKSLKNQLNINAYIYPISSDLCLNTLSSSYHFNSTVRRKIGMGNPNQLTALSSAISKKISCLFYTYPPFIL
nr:type VI secretion protein IcmF/TssM N-terminal domain-containing protein [uncultured Moellerella sp.]